MKNIFCHIPRENWIVDRMGREFLNYSSHNISNSSIEENTDIIWLLASWCWDQIPLEILARKFVVCTIHHEVPEKFDQKRKRNFLIRDKFVNCYLTYTEETKEFINSLTTKPIKIIPHWINQDMWNILDKNECRSALNLPQDRFLIGSFQRDTEGSDLISPKLEKGPDILVDKIKDITNIRNDVHVVLAGWRRQYVIKNLEKLNIPYTYFELPPIEKVNQLYNSLDLYVISSRCEGGPQSIFETSYLKLPVLSTKVGQFKFLSKKCLYDHEDVITKKMISDAENAVEENYNNVKKLEIRKFCQEYDNFFEELRYEI